jgi:hypothetical protein
MDFLSGWNPLLLALALAFTAGAFAVWQANIDTPIYKVQFVSPFHYNAKGDDRIDMTGWSLRNERNGAFTFALAPPSLRHYSFRQHDLPGNDVLVQEG